MLARVIEVGLRESRKITVLRLEPDELCEERQRLVGGAHCNGTGKGADDGNEAKYEIKHRQSFADPPAEGRLGCLAMLTGFFHCERSKAESVKPDCSAALKNRAPSSPHIYMLGDWRAAGSANGLGRLSMPEQVAVQALFCEYFQVHFG